MELINPTRLVAAYTVAMEPSGRELLVVVVKGTFALPQGREPVALASEQLPLVMADVFFGDPGRSAPRYESDFAARKGRCDVLLHASAYAPEGSGTTRTRVGVRIGKWSKSFVVVGDRNWEVGAGGIRAGRPRPFTRMPITYDRAFGGTDDRSDDPARHAAYTKNPSGCGFHEQLRPEWVDGTPLPNTEEDGKPVTSPTGDYEPMSLGPIGRHWEPRRRYAGTYDDRWLQNHFPFLPPDFDEQYYQAAPLDQQIVFPVGGEEVVLVNLTPEQRTAFVLPAFESPIQVYRAAGGWEDGTLALDTLLIEPDWRRFSLVWRATRPLKRNVFEISQVVIGERRRPQAAVGGPAKPLVADGGLGRV